MLHGERYVPNDITFEPGEAIRVITGPNSPANPTCARRLDFLDGQMGSFVPANSATLGLVDRILHASAHRMKSMPAIHIHVEMIEWHTPTTPHPAAYLILDEIGRGTMYDDAFPSPGRWLNTP